MLPVAKHYQLMIMNEYNILVLFFYLGGAPVTVPTSWSDFPSHAGVPKLIPNPLAVDNVSLEFTILLFLFNKWFQGLQ